MNKIAVAARLELAMDSRLSKTAGFLLRKLALTSKNDEFVIRIGPTSSLIPAASAARHDNQIISCCVVWWFNSKAVLMLRQAMRVWPSVVLKPYFGQ